MDCKHEEYDMEGRHCKLSHCAKGVGMRCKRDYSEWCDCYESINGKKKYRNDPLKPPKTGSNAKKEPKNIYHYVVEKDTYAIRKDASTNDGEFVKLLNEEIKQLVNNFFFEYIKGYCIKQSELAEDTKQYCEQKSVEMLKSGDHLNHNLNWKNAAYFDGQIIAYKNVIGVLEDVLKSNNCLGDDIKK